MTFARKAEPPTCPDRRHAGSTVWSKGTVVIRGHEHRRYRCVTPGGKAHYFTVAVGDPPAPLRLVTTWQPGPPCPRHPGSHVVRDGFSPKTTETRRARQRYRCTHDDAHDALCEPNCPGFHRFTPPSPRAYIGHGFEACEFCDEPRGVHRGKPFVAHRHTFDSLTVAGGLIRLAACDSYGEVGRWAIGQRKRKVASRATGTSKVRQKAAADNRWHIAADWCETFAPVIWEPLDAELRAKALAARRRIDDERVRGLPMREPLIWIADELPINIGKRQVFCVLVVAQCYWTDGVAEPEVKVRLARAMPDRSMASWLIVLHELAGADLAVCPDFLVCDVSGALLAAARKLLPNRFLWVPSVWHLVRNLRKAGTGSFTGRLPQEIEEEFALVRRGGQAVSSPDAWSGWWQRVSDLYNKHGLPSLATRRKIYEEPYRKVLAVFPTIPLSNAGVEAVIANRIQPVFYRRTAFTSIERTNSLLDLVVARAHGKLDNAAEVAQQLRRDAHDHDGLVTPARSVADPTNTVSHVRYQSLRDTALPVRVAYERGLA